MLRSCDHCRCLVSQGDTFTRLQPSANSLHFYLTAKKTKAKTEPKEKVTGEPAEKKSPVKRKTTPKKSSKQNPWDTGSESDGDSDDDIAEISQVLPRKKSARAVGKLTFSHMVHHVVQGS